MSPSLPTWSLACTLHGAPESVAPFVAHHLSLPARAVHVFLDAPNPAVQALFAQAGPRLIVTICDAAWWKARRGGRPDEIYLRQFWNMEAARRASDADWMVHIDSDEFLVPVRDGAPGLADCLAGCPADVGWARISTRERVLSAGAPPATVFDGLFRDQVTDPDQEQRIYRDDRRFLRNGFSGYVRGKYAIRTRFPLEVRQHEAVYPGHRGLDARDRLPPFHRIDDQIILHFDGWTALQWTAKLIRRADSGRLKSGHRGRQAQIAYMVDAPDGAARAALFDRLQMLRPRRAAALRDLGLLRAAPFDPRPAVDALFPGHGLSFAPADFDARMIAADRAFFRRTGLVAD